MKKTMIFFRAMRLIFYTKNYAMKNFDSRKAA